MWDTILERLKNEPIVVWNAVVAFIESILVLVVLFGLDLSESQQAGIISALVAFGGIFAALMGRRSTTPTRGPQRERRMP